MPIQKPSSTGGGKIPRGRRHKRNSWDPLAGRGNIGGRGNPAIGFSPTPNSGFQMVNNDPMSIINQIYAGTKKNQVNKKLSKGLPPIAPDIIPPGTGAASRVARVTGSTGSASSIGNGANVGAGRRPSTPSTSLSVNDDGTLARAKNAASIEYNPQIEAVRGLIQQTQNQAQSGIADTTDAYGALQGQIKKEIPGIGSNFDTQQAKIAGLYSQLSGGIDQRYNDTAARDKAEFERLGIQDATPAVMQGQTSDRDFLSQIAKLQGQGVNDALEVEQQGAQNLARNTGYRAGLEGANRASDMRNTLADKILELRTQKTTLKGAKGKSTRELADQYHTEAVSQAERDRAFGLDAAQFQESVTQDRRNFRYTKSQDAVDTELKQAGLGIDAAKVRAAAVKDGKIDLKSLDPQETVAYKANQLVPGSGDRMFAYLQNLINSDPNIRRGVYIKTDASSGRTREQKITPEQFGYLARKHAKVTGLPPGSVQKIATAYWMEH